MAKTPQEKGRLYEQSVLRRFPGMKLRKASGAGPHAKADALYGKLLVEMKYTEANSYSLKKETLETLWKQASNEGRYPALLANINGLEVLVVDPSWLEELKSYQ